MLIPLLFLFILVPLADLVLLMIITKASSVWVTMGLVILAGIGGVWLARRHWRMLSRQARARLAKNEIPGDLASDAIVILLAAGLLVIPGIVTDILGLSLLVPVCRNWYKSRFLNWLKTHFRVKVLGDGYDTQWTDDDVVDGEYRPTGPDELKTERPLGHLPK